MILIKILEDLLHNKLIAPAQMIILRLLQIGLDQEVAMAPLISRVASMRKIFVFLHRSLIERLRS
jgi:hypothetical protein